MNKNIFQSFHHAFYGLVYLFKSQKNVKFHLLATILVVMLGIWLHIPIINWLFIIIAIFVVWISELINTSIEYVFNLIEPKYNHAVKTGKDIAAAAVLFSALLSVIIGLIALGPLLFDKVKSLLR